MWAYRIETTQPKGRAVGRKGCARGVFYAAASPSCGFGSVTESAQRCRTQRPGTPPADAEEPGGNYLEKEAGSAGRKPARVRVSVAS